MIRPRLRDSPATKDRRGAAPIRPCLKAKRAGEGSRATWPASEPWISRVVSDTRDSFSRRFTPTPRRAAPVESGQPMSWERFLSRPVPDKCRDGGGDGSVPSAVSRQRIGCSFGRLMIRRRGRGDRTSWTRHAKGIWARDCHPEYRRRARGRNDEAPGHGAALRRLDHRRR